LETIKKATKAENIRYIHNLKNCIEAKTEEQIKNIKYWTPNYAREMIGKAAKEKQSYLIQAAKGMGKTFTIATLPYGKFLFVVNARKLRSQIKREVESSARTCSIIEVDGDNIQFNNNADVIVITAHKLHLMGKQENYILHALEGRTIVVDECQAINKKHILTVLDLHKPTIWLTGNNAIGILGNKVLKTIPKSNIWDIYLSEAPQHIHWLCNPKKINWNKDSQLGDLRFTSNKEYADIRAEYKPRKTFGKDFEAVDCSVRDKEISNKINSGEKLTSTVSAAAGISIKNDTPKTVEIAIQSNLSRFLNGFQYSQAIDRLRGENNESFGTLSTQISKFTFEDIQLAVHHAKKINVKSFIGLKEIYKVAINIAEMERNHKVELCLLPKNLWPEAWTGEARERATHWEVVKRRINNVLESIDIEEGETTDYETWTNKIKSAQWNDIISAFYHHPKLVFNPEEPEKTGTPDSPIEAQTYFNFTPRQLLKTWYENENILGWKFDLPVPEVSKYSNSITTKSKEVIGTKKTVYNEILRKWAEASPEHEKNYRKKIESLRRYCQKNNLNRGMADVRKYLRVYPDTHKLLLQYYAFVGAPEIPETEINPYGHIEYYNANAVEVKKDELIDICKKR
jgi:hypothetical protein